MTGQLNNNEVQGIYREVLSDISKLIYGFQTEEIKLVKSFKVT